MGFVPQMQKLAWFEADAECRVGDQKISLSALAMLVRDFRESPLTRYARCGDDPVSRLFCYLHRLEIGGAWRGHRPHGDTAGAPNGVEMAIFATLKALVEGDVDRAHALTKSLVNPWAVSFVAEAAVGVIDAIAARADNNHQPGADAP